MAARQIEIAGYVVDTGRPVQGLVGGGLTAFAAKPARGDATPAFAVRCRTHHPPRLRAIGRLPDAETLPGLLLPLGHGLSSAGDDEPARYIMYPVPPGQALMTAGERRNPLGETDLIQNVAKPIARVLGGFADAGLTHRSIRPDNLFRPLAGGPVTVGEAFALPPGFAQPAVFEPCGMAMCSPAGKGEGTVEDDLYALGVTLLALATGQWPLAGLDDRATIRLRLERGSLAALVGTARLPASVATLLRGLLAEDPSYRPSFDEIALWPGGARGRPQTARPVRKATRPFDFAGEPILDARSLAFSMASRWSEGLRVARSAALIAWLDRALGDATLTERVAGIAVSDPSAGEADGDVMLSRVLSAIDPQGPLWWRGIAMMPDGLGTMLAEAHAAPNPNADRQRDLADMIEAQALSRFAAEHPERADMIDIDKAGRSARAQSRARVLGGGKERLLYQLNPGLPCLSPMVRNASASTLPALLAALEVVAATSPPGGGAPTPIDRHVAGFIGANMEGQLDTLLAAAGDTGRPEDQALATVSVFARLQRLQRGLSLPNLAKWVAKLAAPAVNTWYHKAQRARVEKELPAAATAGDFAAMIQVLDNPSARNEDRGGFAEAAATFARAAAAGIAMRAEAPLRRAEAARVGGLAAQAIALVLLGGTVLLLTGG
ncbi:hypothetical protein [Elioraea sp.]|uniref:hypothetical protein n=1 Tax=Elioraea sp. TaxID=2185103 RepID=UPI0025BA4E41|nr:hypothetical protein [Elioraea sp.]